MKLSRETIEYMRTQFVARTGKSTIADHLLPSANETVNLGSAARKWDTIYVRNLVADYLTGSGGAADTVDGFHAYASPNADALLALDGTAKFTLTAIPQGHGSGLNADKLDNYEGSEFAALAENETITAQWSFSPGTVQAPFVLGANAQSQLVIGLRADELNKSVNAGNGMTGGGALTSNVTLSLQTPGTLSVSSSNNPAGNHTHAITSNWYPGATACILATNSSGYLGLVSLGIGVSPSAANVIEMSNGSKLGIVNGTNSYFIFSNTYVNFPGRLRIGTTSTGGSETVAIHGDSGQLTLYYASDPAKYADFGVGVNGSITIGANANIILAPGGQHVNPSTSYFVDLGAYNYKWRTLYCAELYVETLVAQDVLATIGGRIMVAPTTKLTQDISDTDTTIYTEHNLLAVNDYLYLASAPGGAAQFEVMQVTAGPSGSGPYSYTVTRNIDGSGANYWKYGDAVVNLGYAAGEGYIDLTSTQTIHAQIGPTITIFSRTSGSTWNASKPVVTMGNLDSFLGYGTEYGLALGNDVSLSDAQIDTFKGATLDRTNGLRLFNTDLRIYTSTSPVIALLGGTYPYVAIGSPIPTGWLSNSGIWMGKHTDTSYRSYVGVVSGGVLTAGYSWDGTEFRLVGNQVIGPGVGYIASDVTQHCPFDGPRPYKRDFQVNTNGDIGQVGTIEGGICGRPGKFGKGVCVGVSITNYCGNPRAEVDATSWWTTAEWSRDTSDSYVGVACYKSTGGVNWTDLDSASITATNDEVWTLQFRYRRDGDANWTWCKRTVTTQASGVTTIKFNIYTNVSNSLVPKIFTNIGTLSETGETTFTSYVLVDAIQFEKLGYASPYFDGDFGSGYSWAGTAHASYSTRANPRLRYAVAGVLDFQKPGSISFWFYDDRQLYGYYPLLFQTYYDADNYISITSKHSGDSAYKPFCDGKVASTYFATYGSGSALESVAGWNNIIVAWTPGGVITFYLNGVQSGTTPTFPTGYVNSTIFVVGSSAGGASQCNTIIDDFVIFDKELPSDEARAIASSSGPLQCHTNKFEIMLTGLSAGKVWGHAGGLFGQAADGTASFALFNADYTGSWGGFTNPGQGDVIFGHNKTGSSAIQWDRSTGKWGFYGNASSTVQVEVNTLGEVTAGAGAVILGSTGLRLTEGTGAVNSLKWFYSSTQIGTIYTGYAGGSRCEMKLRAEGISGASEGRILLDSFSNVTSANAQLYLYAATNATILMWLSDTAHGSSNVFQANLTSGVQFFTDVFNDAWTDWSGTSITGWTTYSTKYIRYKKIGKLVFIAFQIVGESNNTSTSFVLPYQAASTNIQHMNIIRTQDNSGSWTAGLAYVSAGASSLVFAATVGGATWTASNTKGIHGEFWYEASS